MKSLSRVRLLATPWTAAYQAPPSTGFSRQEYCSGLPLPSEGRQNENHNHRKLTNLTTWTTALSNSMKLSHAMWGHPDERVMVERSDRMWSTGEGNGKSLQYSCLENPMYSMKRQNDSILKEELPRLVGAQHDTRDQWRNNSRNNEGMDPKQKQSPEKLKKKKQKPGLLFRR